MTPRVRALGLLVPAGLLALALAGCSGGAQESSAGSGATGSAAPTASAAAVPSTAAPTGAATTGGAPVSAAPAATPTSTEVVPAPADGAIPELPPVAVGATVEAGGGLSAEVVRIEASEIEGGVPGDIAGPAVAVTVAVSNTGTSPADIGFVVVSAGYGEGQEAPGYEGGPADPLVGPVPPGETRRGTYVFGVPEQGAGTLEVRVGTDPARPLAVFTADASVWGDR